MHIDTDTRNRLILLAVAIAALAAILAADARPRPAQPSLWPACPNGPCPYELVRGAELPVEWRERNYAGGSCVHASMVMVLRWQGLGELADWWRQTYAGGETSSGLIAKADRAGLRFAYTRHADPAFLDWASRTRRGAVIFYFQSHSIVFCGFAETGEAVLLDNNRPDRFLRIPRQQFLSAWRGYGGFALTVVYSPPAPRPWI